MSAERPSNPSRPLKPALASSRTVRSPLAPRVAPGATPSARQTIPKAPSSVRSEPPTPRVKQTVTPVKDALANGNVTPRSAARVSKAGSASVSPASTTRPKSAVMGPSAKSNGIAVQDRAQPSRPLSMVVGKEKTQLPLAGSPALLRVAPQSPEGGSVGQFFHASDAPKQEQPSKKPEPQKKAQFFHADGKQETKIAPLDQTSPVLSAISEQQPNVPWIRAEDQSQPPATPPIRSPTVSAISSTSPFFSASTAQAGKTTSPPRTKENIHLSYRKGVSQILGIRPALSPRSTSFRTDNTTTNGGLERRLSKEPPLVGSIRHQKSPSLSSIDSGNSLHFRRSTSSTFETLAAEQPPSPPAQETTSPAIARSPRSPRIPLDLPSIDTSLESPGVLSRTESGLSPTKPGSDLAADARRERKVLDLEISNSSLLAINASLEREVRRQRAELKRFRRLSRAGRFSFAPGDRSRVAMSDELTVLEEEDEFEGLPSARLALDDLSDEDDDEEESVVSSSGPLSASAQERLARDEKRLQMDLEKHKELLVQSQAMNQSIKRCMYATEDMIREGKKALEYHVRVSDVKLGGRVLSTHHEDGDEHLEINVDDEIVQNDEFDRARDFLESWTDVGPPSIEGSEGGDRDSGIEVERPSADALPLGQQSESVVQSWKPRRLWDGERFGSFA